MKYTIENIDYWEQDAFLCLEDGRRIFFQFPDSNSVNLEQALVYLFNEGLIEFKDYGD